MATAADARTLAIAVSQAARPARTLTPRRVSGASSAGAHHAAQAA